MAVPANRDRCRRDKWSDEVPHRDATTNKSTGLRAPDRAIAPLEARTSGDSRRPDIPTRAKGGKMVDQRSVSIAPSARSNVPADLRVGETPLDPALSGGSFCLEDLAEPPIALCEKDGSEIPAIPTTRWGGPGGHPFSPS